MKRLQEYIPPIIVLLLLVAGCAPATTPPPAATSAPPATLAPTAAPAPTVTPEPTPAPYAVAWEFQTGGEVWSSPAVSEQVVYFGSDDGNLYAVNAQTGQETWRFETGGFVRSRPAIFNGAVYFTSDDGYLYAVDASTGQERWRSGIGNADVPRIEPNTTNIAWDYQQSSPAIAEGVAYVGSADRSLYAVDAATGQEKWRFETGGLVRSSPAVAAGIAYVGSWDGNVYAVDTQTGQEIWRFDTRARVQPSPTVVDGVVYIGSKASILFALDAQTGKVKWRFRYVQAWVESSATIVADTLYIGSALDNRVYALDRATGKKRWEFYALGDDFTLAVAPFSSPAVVDGIVYIGGVGISSAETEPTEGYFFAIDAQTGEKKWHLTTGQTPYVGGVASSPAVAGGLVYFGSLDGKLYAVRCNP